MKQIFIFLLLVVGCVNLKAQWTVSDPAGLVVQTKQLAEAGRQTMELSKQGVEQARQTTQLIQSVNLLKKSIEFVESVNSQLRGIILAKDVISAQVNLVSDCSNLMSNINKKNALRNTKQISQSVGVIIQKNRVLTELLSKTLSTSFKMNDSERVGILMKIMDDTNELSKLLDRIETTNSISNDMYKLIKR